MLITPEEARDMGYKVRTPGSKVRSAYKAQVAAPIRKKKAAKKKK
jgi:hypothetical protein